MSTVDVCVPCYRYGHFLRECVTSILTQAEVDVRVLIIDDASPDDSAEIGRQLAKEDSRITFVEHLANKGHIATYNEGIEWASADYFLLLSADDYLLPGALDLATKLMDSHPEVGFIFGNAIEKQSNGGTKEFGQEESFFGNQDHRILNGIEFIQISGVRNIVPTPTAIIRTALQKKSGGYKPDLLHAGDLEMWFRLATYAKVGVIKKPLAVYRRHDSNMSLEYTANYWLSDLEQRRLTIFSFIESRKDALPDAFKLQEKCLHSLSLEAIGWASTAFNKKNLELCNQLIAFAVDSSQNIKSTMPWLKLSCKRLVGYRLWHIMQPAFYFLFK